jgi:hypothetical protein
MLHRALACAVRCHSSTGTVVHRKKISIQRRNDLKRFWNQLEPLPVSELLFIIKPYTVAGHRGACITYCMVIQVKVSTQHLSTLLRQTQSCSLEHTGVIWTCARFCHRVVMQSTSAVTQSVSNVKLAVSLYFISFPVQLTDSAHSLIHECSVTDRNATYGNRSSPTANAFPAVLSLCKKMTFHIRHASHYKYRPHILGSAGERLFRYCLRKAICMMSIGVRLVFCQRYSMPFLASR